MEYFSEFLHRYSDAIRQHNGAVWIDWATLSVFDFDLAATVRTAPEETIPEFAAVIEDEWGFRPAIYFETVQPLDRACAYRTDGLTYAEAFEASDYRLVTAVAHIVHRRDAGKYTRLTGRSICPPTDDEVTLKVPPAIDTVPESGNTWFSGVWDSDREEINVHSFADERPAPDKI